MNGTQENQKLESVQNVNQHIGIKKREKLTKNMLEKLFRYDNGDLIWKVSTGNQARKGDCAGSENGKGYIRTKISGRMYYNHRLIWLLHHGYMPEGFLDHTDRNKSNNRIENLREASAQCNARNTGNPVGNTSGVKGVSWNKANVKWEAKIKINQKKFHLGYYNDFTEAVAHRLAAEQCVNWSGCDSNSPAFQYMSQNTRRP